MTIIIINIYFIVKIYKMLFLDKTDEKKLFDNNKK